MIGRKITSMAIAALTDDQSDGSLWEMVSGRFFETQRPQTAEMPCIEALTPTIDIEPSFDDVVGAETRIMSNVDGELIVRIYAPLGDQETQTQSAAAALIGELAQRVRALLEGTQRTDGTLTITYIERVAEIITYSDEAAVGEMRFAALGATCVMESI